jgi:hypothetical protein
MKNDDLAGIFSPRKVKEKGIPVDIPIDDNEAWGKRPAKASF